MEKTKYNNGNSQDIDEIPQEEMSLAISEWAEGDESLQKAISSCIENGIPTITSCAGHSSVDYPYLAMKVNGENMGKILNIINAFINQTNTSIALSLTENGSALTIYGNMFNKKKCFEIISQEAQNSLELENANDITRSLWNAHVTLTTHRYDINTKLYNSIEYVNGIARKRLIISPLGNEALEQILTESGMKSTKTMFGSTVMTKSSSRRGISETLDRVCCGIIDNLCESLEDDELIRGKTKNKTGEIDHVKKFSNKMQEAAQKEQQDRPKVKEEQGGQQDVTDSKAINTDGIDRDIDD